MKNSTNYLKIIIILLFGIFTLLNSENKSSVDFNDIVADSVFVDSTAISGFPDSTDVFDIDIDSTAVNDSIFYKADSIFFNILKKKITLYSNAEVKYKNATIESDTIHIDQEAEQAYTKGTTWMKDGQYNLLGDGLYFDLESKKGIIVKGASQFDLGFYYGDEIRKVDEETFDIDNGIFTTCKAAHPHFWIQSYQMRIYRNDKVVARPIIFYVNHFPVFGFPYASYSIKRGRKSGILMPEPGYNKSEGKTLKEIAYYYAYKDYADLLWELDYMEKKGWEGRFSFDYIKRYFYRGDLFMRFQNNKSNSSYDKNEWLLKANHHHDLPNKATFDLSLHFVSSKQVYNTDQSIDDRTTETITSRFAYKRPFLGRYLNVSGNYKENLEDDTKDMTLPSISFTPSSKPLSEIFPGKGGSNKDGILDKFTLKYSFKAVHVADINEKNAGWDDLFYKTKKDSVGDYLNNHNAGVKHTGGISFSHKLGWLNLSQSLSASEAWFDRDKNNKKLVRGNDYNLSTSANFSMYGLRKFNNFYISAVRHIINPRVSFSYTPDFSENDRFYSFGGVGLRSGKKSRNVSFSLSNKWQLKLAKTENRKEKKLDNFFKIDSKISYNLEAEGKGFSDISHRVSLNPAELETDIFEIDYSNSGSVTQDAYNFETLKWSVGTDLKISGDANYIDYFPEIPNKFESNKFFEVEEDTLTNEESINSFQDLEDLEEIFETNDWSVSLSHDLTKNLESDTRSSSLKSSLTAKLSKNWYLNYSNYYDLEENELRSQDISLNRDLHCWKLTIKYTRSAEYWSYNVQFFNIKLPDSLKFKQKDSGNNN